MTKFVMTYRRSRNSTRWAKQDRLQPLNAAVESLGASRGLELQSVIGGMSTSEDTSTTRVFEMEPNRVEELQSALPNEVIIEEAVEFQKLDDPPFDMLKTVPFDLYDPLQDEPLVDGFAGNERSIKIDVKGVGERGRHVPLIGAEVYLFLDGPGGLTNRLQKRTDANGVASFDFGDYYRIRACVVAPYAKFWPAEHRGDPERSSQIKIVCTPLPEAGPSDWWHSILNAEADLKSGIRNDDKPIRVGVIDSGCGPNRSLSHVADCGAYIDGQYSKNGADSGSHGTHVCGTIGARLVGNAVPFMGVSAGVELYSVGVFPPNGTANQGDIAEAIDLLVEDYEVDLINMSLGATDSSQILEDAIDAAYNAGTVCVCAAGNDNGPVSYPAALEKTIAIAALGQTGRVPLSSMPAYPASNKKYGTHGLYAASFTNSGPEIDHIAPGVGIIAPVPDRFGMDDCYAAMNGTSMASPAACGKLAVLLSQSEEYASMPRNEHRSRFAMTLLAAKSETIRIDQSYEGRGVPRLT